MQSELDLLRLPDVPRIVLHHSPLALALCQVRFSSMLSVTDPASLAAFQRAIQSQYPIGVPLQEAELFIGIETNEPEIRREQRRSPQYQFTDQNDNWKIVLSQDFLTLETRNYEHFDDFLARLREALDALVQHIQPTVVTRLGLRYINEIRSNGLNNIDWSDIIQQDLLGPVTVSELVENTSQIASMQQLLLRYPDDLGVNIQHGLIPSGTTVQLRPKEEPPKQAFYLLDYDVYREFPLAQGLLMNTEAICHHVEIYHTMIYRLFRWSVSGDYLSTLEE